WLLPYSESDSRMRADFFSARRVMHLKHDVGSRREYFRSMKGPIVLRELAWNITALDAVASRRCRKRNSAAVCACCGFQRAPAFVARPVCPNRFVVNDVRSVWLEKDADVMRDCGLAGPDLHGRDPRVFL